jgi:hypothetical protein
VRARTTAVLLAGAIGLATVFVAFPLSDYPNGEGVTTIWERAHIDWLAPTLRVEGRTSVGLGVVLSLAVLAALASATYAFMPRASAERRQST